MKHVLTGLIAITLLLGGTVVGAHAKKPIDLVYVGGGPGGISYHQGAALSGYCARKYREYRVSVQSSAGGIEMLRLLGRKEVEISMAVGAEIGNAWYGEPPFEKRYTNIRAIGVSFLAPLNWVTTKGKNIKKISDLVGKAMSPGPLGSSGANSIDRMLTLLGIKDKVKLNYLPYAESASALKAGHIDLYNVFGVPPHAVISQTFATVGDATIFDFGDELEKSGFFKKYPGYIPTYIKGGLYPGLDKDVKTYGTTYVWTIHIDVPEDVAYEITRVIYSDDFMTYAKKVIEGPFKRQKELMETGNPTLGAGVPLHPGSEKAMRELGYKILSPTLEDMKK